MFKVLVWCEASQQWVVEFTHDVLRVAMAFATTAVREGLLSVVERT